jgi:hypothetical protein
MAGISEALRQAATPGIQWGRWASVAGQSANIDLLQAKQTAQLVGLNSYFAVFRHHGSANWVAPQEPAASFRLWGSDAQIATAAGAQKASLENGYLHVDFVRGNFSTGFGLTQGANTWSRQAQGPLVGDGTFGNASQYLGGNNMVVRFAGGLCVSKSY